MTASRLGDPVHTGQNKGYSLADTARPISVLKFLLEARHNLRMIPSELERYRNRRLHQIIMHAYETVLFYRELFDAQKIDPQNIRSTNDLSHLPVIDKNMLRKIPLNERISTTFSGKPLRKMLTGGSTGEPFDVYESEEASNRRAAYRLRMFFLHGCSLFDKKATVAGLSGRVKYRWFNHLGLVRRIEIPFDSPVPDQVGVILREKPTIYEGYPSRLHLIAKYLLERKVTVKIPKTIFTDSETLLPHMRQTIEAAFRAPVTNVYDSYEFGYTAWECKDHRGLHINADSQIVQIMKDGSEVEDGHAGDIVVTDLDNYAMPLIRYDIGDRGTKSRTKCDCGISFPLLEGIHGRKWDYLISPTLGEVSALAVEQFVRRYDGITEYRIVQNSIDSLDIYITQGAGYAQQTDSQIRNQLQTLYGFKEIAIKHPDCVERTKSGKLRCVHRNF